MAADSYKNGNDQIVPVLMPIPCDRATYPAADEEALRRVCEAVTHLGEACTRRELGEAVAREIET
ncbi:MAG: hypothetical protein GKC05_06990, partial [Methanomicrobiales archaeon]|nr:hypothetical protein [Methanomicrobiales archaeon]